MRLLILSNNLLRPSYRQRIGDFTPYLNDAGIETTVTQLPKGKMQRWSLLRSARHYDAVLLHKKCLNYFDSRILRRHSRRLIYDFDDAVMYSPHQPQSDRSSHMRLFKRTASMADCMIAGNEYLAEHARRFCSKVYVLPTGLDLRPYTDVRDVAVDDRLRLVWIGSQSTLKYLQSIAPVLDDIADDSDNITLRAIADDFPELKVMEIERHRWSLQTQASDLGVCRIGLAPLPDNRFTRGKCGFKILQYFAAGLPVVASPVGVNRDLIEKSGAGMLAETPEQWKQAIEQLVANQELRTEMGQKARHFIADYDTPVLAKRFVEIVQTEMQSGGQ